MKTLVVALLVSVVCFGQAVPSVKHGYGSPEGVVAGVIGDIYQRQDGGAGTTFYVKQSANSFNFGWVAYASSGAPGGSDGNIQANIAGAFGAAKQDLVDAPAFCSDAGSTDAYACTLAPAITAYVTGTHYRFKAATANTGAATINFNALGAKTVVKVAGGITTALADSDIRAGQWVDVVYDGTNMQMQSTLGNVASSVTCPAGVAGYIQFYISAGLCGGDSNLTWDNTTKTLSVGTSLSFDAAAGVETGADISTPANPSASHTKLYAKGGKWCSLSPAGVENCLGAGGGSPGGSDTQLQYRVDATTFGGTELTWDPTLTFVLNVDTNLNDLDCSVGTGYTGPMGYYFDITIDATGTPDTFAWTQNVPGGGVYNPGASGIAITGGVQNLTDGVACQFGATTGHALNDDWNVLTGRSTLADVNVLGANTPYIAGPSIGAGLRPLFASNGVAIQMGAVHGEVFYTQMSDGTGTSQAAAFDANGNVTGITNAAGALTNDGAGNLSWATGASPGGSATELQYRAGATTFGAMSGTGWDSTSRALTANDPLINEILRITWDPVSSAGGIAFGYNSGGFGPPDVTMGNGTAGSEISLRSFSGGNTTDVAAGGGAAGSASLVGGNGGSSPLQGGRGGNVTLQGGDGGGSDTQSGDGGDVIVQVGGGATNGAFKWRNPNGQAISWIMPASITPYPLSVPDAQGTGALTNDGSGGLNWQSGGLTTLAFASLGTPADGFAYYCSDCKVTTVAANVVSDSTCTNGGSGSFALRAGGAWKCSYLP